jgi:broad specificity phosphatase PhoE
MTQRFLPNNRVCLSDHNCDMPIKSGLFTHVSSPVTAAASPTIKSNTQLTLYLIRHAEAFHNVQEFKAQQEALQEAQSSGLTANHPETLRRMEEARQKVLEDCAFFDAPLSEDGLKQAEGTCHTIEHIVKETGLPAPTEVLVSPLHRALQTAHLVFPDHHDIHVREELRERLTGRPADNRVSSSVLSRRPTFSRFSFKNLRSRSIVNIASMRNVKMQECKEDSEEEEKEEMDHSESDRPESSFNTNVVVEDEAKLHERTYQLLYLLATCKSNSVAIVTHKGYLRGLERGPLKQTGAKNFGNCEVRVYNLDLHVDGANASVKSAQRVR